VTAYSYVATVVMGQHIAI